MTLQTSWSVTASIIHSEPVVADSSLRTVGTGTAVLYAQAAELLKKLDNKEEEI